jgi:hypothetical protein
MSMWGRFQDREAELSVFDFSLETANCLYKWGWRGSIFGAIITALAVVSLMLGTRVRDYDFETRVTESNAVASQAHEKAASLEVEAAKLRENTVGLESDLEKERMLRVKMQKEISWRRITPEQHTKLVEMLQAHPMTVDLEAVAGDPESTLFADDIRRTLVAAGFTVKAALKNFMGPMHGLGVSTTPPNEQLIVATAFTSANVGFGADEGPTSELRIVVGSKMPSDPRLLSDVVVPVRPAK